VWKGRAAASEPPRPWERLDEPGEHDPPGRPRLEHLAPVPGPLGLISQVQRAGGTLPRQPFHGHPECHAHPYELHIGHPGKAHSPPLDLDEPARWFELLYERYPRKHLVEGYRKQGVRKGEPPSARTRPADVFPFLFLPRLQQAIFERCVAEGRVESERDVLDCYFTSYFNAWLDNHNLYNGPKRIVTGFVPWLAVHPENVEKLFAAYPDGWLVSIVRDARSWYASARPHHARYADVDDAVGRWRRSVEAILDARKRFPDRVLVVTYEDLVAEPEAVMEAIAERIGIEMSPVLLRPTFNGRPIRANSSEPVDRYGILADRSDAHGRLEAETVARVEALAGDLYERAVASIAEPVR